MVVNYKLIYTPYYTTSFDTILDFTIDKVNPHKMGVLLKLSTNQTRYKGQQRFLLLPIYLH